mmetsp:Transcript_128748/g.412452  ORF Transcript_128748/g.412452 Transcript_128748/m.412452 type:complete len:282 (-) Transcript_128748:270-1115(-)
MSRVGKRQLDPTQPCQDLQQQPLRAERLACAAAPAAAPRRRPPRPSWRRGGAPLPEPPPPRPASAADPPPPGPPQRTSPRALTPSPPSPERSLRCVRFDSADLGAAPRESAGDWPTSRPTRTAVRLRQALGASREPRVVWPGSCLAGVGQALGYCQLPRASPLAPPPLAPIHRHRSKAIACLQHPKSQNGAALPSSLRYLWRRLELGPCFLRPPKKCKNLESCAPPSRWQWPRSLRNDQRARAPKKATKAHRSPRRGIWRSSLPGRLPQQKPSAQRPPRTA